MPTKEQYKNNKKQYLKQKKKYREKYKDKLNKINLIRIHSFRNLKPFLVFKYGGCQLCKSSEKLEIHHIKYTTNFEDVILLCRKCHIELHKKVSKQTKNVYNLKGEND